MTNFKKILLTAVAVTAMSAATPTIAEDVTLGFLGGFTGPAESLMPPIVGSIDMLVNEVNSNGGILGGTLSLATADAGCEATLAGSAADRLVNVDNVSAIIGGICSSETIAGANVAGIPGNTVMISPSSTAPVISTLDDNDLVFRVAPSDAFQGVQLANLLLGKGITEVALTYVNGDYGKGLADAFSAAYEAAGGTITASQGHEEGKADYRAELGNLASGGSTNLVILAFASGSGQTILRQAIEAGDFTKFVGGDGMVGDETFTGIDISAVEGMIATRPGSLDVPGADIFVDVATAAGVDPSGTFAPQSYDAAFMLALAIQQKGNASRDGMSAALREVASAPGEAIFPGEWAKAVEILAGGGEVNYEGASGLHEFDAAGDVDGVIVEMTVEGGDFIEVGPIM